MLNGVLHFGFTILFQKMDKKDDTFLRKKAEENPNIATIIISVDGKTTAFQLKLKLQEELLE